METKASLLSNKRRIRPWFDMKPRKSPPPPPIFSTNPAPESNAIPIYGDLEAKIAALDMTTIASATELYTDLKEEMAALKNFVALIPGAPGIPGRAEYNGRKIMLIRYQQQETMDMIKEQDTGELTLGAELANALKRFNFEEDIST